MMALPSSVHEVWHSLGCHFAKRGPAGGLVGREWMIAGAAFETGLHRIYGKMGLHWTWRALRHGFVEEDVACLSEVLAAVALDCTRQYDPADLPLSVWFAHHLEALPARVENRVLTCETAPADVLHWLAS